MDLSLFNYNVLLWKEGSNYSIASKINVTPKGVILSETLHHSVMKFDPNNKFDLCFYGQVNSPRLRSSVNRRWYIYFAGDGTYFAVSSQMIAYGLFPENGPVLRHPLVVSVSQHHRQKHGHFFRRAAHVILMNCNSKDNNKL